jgi:hypothetical protein
LNRSTIVLACSLVTLSCFAVCAATDTLASAAAASPAAQSDSSVGSLIVRTTPDSATVVIDGASVGQSPVRIDSLRAGQHKLQIAHEGYLTRSATVALRGGATQEVQFALSQPAALTLLSEPSGARVSLNNAQLGTTPLTSNGLRPGQYAFTLVRDGYEPVSDTASLGSGATDTLRINLTPLTTPVAVVAARSPGATPRRRVAGVVALCILAAFAAVIFGVEAAQQH